MIYFILHEKITLVCNIVPVRYVPINLFLTSSNNTFLQQLHSNEIIVQEISTGKININC